MDHNLDFLKANKHQNTENFVNSLLEKSLFPCISRPTRITNTTATLIDNIFVSSRLHNNQKSCINIHDISDHFPSLIQIEDVWTKKQESKKILSRCVNQCKIDALKTSLNSIDWSNVYTRKDVNHCYNLFINALTTNIDNHIPLKEVVIPAKQFICESWLTKGLLKCSKKQLKLYEKSLKSGNNDDYTTYKKL